MTAREQIADGTTVSLEEEGEIVADYLEELLDIADLDGDIELDVRNDRAAVEIVADDSASISHLVGKDGEVLDALQDLSRLVIQSKTGQRSRMMLDIAGHRAARKIELVKIAEAAIEEVKERGGPVALDPMNAFERKVVHDTIAAAGLNSDSEGQDPDRRVVVRPA